MSRTWNITNSGGNIIKATVHKLEYSGTFLGESYVTCSVNSPREIEWEIGDKIVYNDNEYLLENLPSLTRNARSYSYGNAIEYKDMKFMSLAVELTRCRFLDFVYSDNSLHFTSLPNFSFICEKVEEFAYRLQVNLDRLYGKNVWTVDVYDPNHSEGSYSKGSLKIHTDGNDPITYINTMVGNGYETLNTDGGTDNKMSFADGNLQLTYTEGNGYVIKTQTLSFSNLSCWDALAQFSNTTNINFIVRGRKVILGYRYEDDITGLSYGKGNGLVDIERSNTDNQDVITRLRAYGNSKNLSYRYYNYVWGTGDGDNIKFMHKRIDSDKESWRCIDIDENDKIVNGYEDGTSEVTADCTRWYRIINSGMYITNLMLPEFRRNAYAINKAAIIEGTQPTFTEFDAYIDSGQAKVIGIREGCVFFDGSDSNLEDIYPSLTAMTNQSIYDALSDAERKEQNIKPDNTEGYFSGAVDHVSDCTETSGDGWDGIIPEESSSSPIFTVYIPNPGFDPGDTELKADETPVLNMLDGACAGRAFTITGCVRVHKDADNNWENVSTEEKANPTNGWWYAVTCSAVADDSIGQYFPNKNYQIMAGDQFVLTGIMMPDVYVRAAEERLESVAKTYLSENDHTQFTYTPKIDNIYMQQHPEDAAKLVEGAKIHLFDQGLDIDDDITISAVKITEGEQLPEYEITLSDEQEATLAQRVSTEINQKFSQYFYFGGSGSGGSYTASSILNKYLKVRTDDNGNVYVVCTVDLASEKDICAYVTKAPESGSSTTDTTDFWNNISLDTNGQPVTSKGTTTTREFILPSMQEEGVISIKWYAGAANQVLVSYNSVGTMMGYYTSTDDAPTTSQVGGYSNSTDRIRMTMPTTEIDKCYIICNAIYTSGNTNTTLLWAGKDYEVSE